MNSSRINYDSLQCSRKRDLAKTIISNPDLAYVFFLNPLLCLDTKDKDVSKSYKIPSEKSPHFSKFAFLISSKKNI